MKVTISQNLLSFVRNAYSDLDHPLKPSHAEIDWDELKERIETEEVA